MAKRPTSLYHGFMFPYSHTPMLYELDLESRGLLFTACIERQKDGKPFPEVENPLLKMVMLSLEAIIANRLNGQKGGEKTAEAMPPPMPPPMQAINNTIRHNTIKDKHNTTSSTRERTEEEEEALDEKFKVFWSKYPKKHGYQEAKNAFSSLDPSDELLEKMLAAIEEQSRSEQWRKGNGQYIPRPSNWIEKKQWNDTLGIQYPMHEIKEEPLPF